MNIREIEVDILLDNIRMLLDNYYIFNTKYGCSFETKLATTNKILKKIKEELK